MRGTPDMTQTTVSFICDIHEGVKVECGYCGNVIEVYEGCNAVKQDCPKCEKELLYPCWCDW